MMVPRTLATRAPHVDVTAAMDEQPRSRAVTLKVIPAARRGAGAQRRRRSVCGSGGVAMADSDAIRAARSTRSSTRRNARG